MSSETSNRKNVGNERKMFTLEEDIRLKSLVEKLGTKKFKAIAELMPGRTTRQVRDRYNMYLAPKMANGPWSREEDELLKEKYIEFGSKWSQIAQFFPTRSPVNVKNRWSSFAGTKKAQLPEIEILENKHWADSGENDGGSDEELENSLFEEFSSIVSAQISDPFVEVWPPF